MPATKQDRQSLNDLIQAHSERLRVLQRQAARMGNDSPPHIITEIERIEAELAQLQQAAAATPLRDELVEEMGPVGRYQLTFSHITRLDTDIRRVRDMAEKIEEQLRASEQRLTARIDEMQYEVLRALGKRPRRRKVAET